jgi:hypothetical protein
MLSPSCGLTAASFIDRNCKMQMKSFDQCVVFLSDIQWNEKVSGVFLLSEDWIETIIPRPAFAGTGRSWWSRPASPPSQWPKPNQIHPEKNKTSQKLWNSHIRVEWEGMRCVCSCSFGQKAHFAATRNKVLQKLHPLADLLPSQLHKRNVGWTNFEINYHFQPQSLIQFRPPLALCKCLTNSKSEESSICSAGCVCTLSARLCLLVACPFRALTCMYPSPSSSGSFDPFRFLLPAAAAAAARPFFSPLTPLLRELSFAEPVDAFAWSVPRTSYDATATKLATKIGVLETTGAKNLPRLISALAPVHRRSCLRSWPRRGRHRHHCSRRRPCSDDPTPPPRWCLRRLQWVLFHFQHRNRTTSASPARRDRTPSRNARDQLAVGGGTRASAARDPRLSPRRRRRRRLAPRSERPSPMQMNP